jgi:3-hydroxyisobutyrate dehydrogenase
MGSTAAPRIAVLGLGILGAVVARKAAQAGLRVTAWDRSPGHLAPLPSQHIEAAVTPRDAVRDADVVVTMLYDADAVFAVMADQGTCDAMKPGAVWLQMSTIGVEGTNRALALAASRPDVAFVDAPVSGSKFAAESRQLVVFASGDRERSGTTVQPFLDTIAGEVHWLGAAGQGTRMGLLFNAWIGILIQDVAEVTALAEALEIAPDRFLELVANGALVPPWALAKFRRIAENRTGEVEVPLRLAHKNVLLALDAAGAQRPRLPALDLIAGRWAELIGDFGDADISALASVSRRRFP